MSKDKTLVIAIDGNEANVTNRVGSNVYAFEIIKSIEAITRKLDDLKFIVLLASEPIADLPKTRAGWTYEVVTPKKFWTQLAEPIYLQKHQSKIDVLFVPGHYAPRISPVPYVSSVMDLAFLNFPDHFLKKDLIQLKNWTKYSVKNASKIIAISEATKKRIQQAYQRKAKDIVVAYPAMTTKITLPAKEIDKVAKRFKLDSRFILHVGTIQPRKNIGRIVSAFEKIASEEEHQDLKLVLAGKYGWLSQDIKHLINSSPAKDKIIVTGYISEKEKWALLRKATCLVQVGLEEGFGIPPLEALTAKTIVVSSNSSSLPEVVGEAGILVNPTSINDITNGIKKALSMSPRDQFLLLARMKTQAQKFSWGKSAKIILNTLVEAALDA